MTEKTKELVKQQIVSITIETYSDDTVRREINLKDVSGFELLGIVEGYAAELRVEHVNRWRKKETK